MLFANGKRPENEIVGEALVALLHDDLKQMGINSVGHRLTILKSVYDVKKAQDVPIDSDHYVPPSKLLSLRTAFWRGRADHFLLVAAESELQSANATKEDVKRLVEQLRLRDERISLAEQDLRKITDEFRRLREDMLPALRLAKDAQQPLPNINNGSQGYGYDTIISPPAPTPSTGGQSGGGLKRQYSTKKITLQQPPPAQKAASPTHLQTSHDRSIIEQTLDPGPAAERAVLSSQHLAAMNGNGQNLGSPSYSPNIPSPTSPPTTLGGTTLASRSYRGDQPTPSTRSTFAGDDHYTSRDKPVAPRRMQTPAPDTPSSSNASVEIFKSFRVSMDDPCYKVLPAALKKYQINAPWDQYALYIVYGDQERCLALDEKPLILFKQLDKEGKKPMFMLRKTNNAQVDITGDPPGSAGLSSASAAAARGASTGYDPPGGII
jgi:hypothetical protein